VLRRSCSPCAAIQPSAVRPPIDVRMLANLCGVRVLAETFVGDLSGVLIELDDEPMIGYHRWQSAGRQRFTIAHELGHHLLQRHDKFHLDLAVTESAEGHSPLSDWRLEREANDFAAYILI
jgi:Zn-dependent peptidase ImmA (M78 family)